MKKYNLGMELKNREGRTFKLVQINKQLMYYTVEDKEGRRYTMTQNNIDKNYKVVK